MLDLLFTDLAYMTFWCMVIQPLATVQAPSLMDPLLKLGNTAGDPLHCLNLLLMCERQLQHEVHQRCRGKGEGTSDTTVVVMATKNLDYQLPNHFQMYSLFIHISD